MKKRYLFFFLIISIGLTVLSLRERATKKDARLKDNGIKMNALNQVQPITKKREKVATINQKKRTVKTRDELVLWSHLDKKEKEYVASSVQKTIAGNSYEERIHHVVYDLPKMLSQHDYKALAGYLLQPQDGKDGDFRQHEYALRNYMMDALREVNESLSETTEILIAVYADQEQGDIMRGYALQHLSSLYLDHLDSLSDGDRRNIIHTLKEAMNNLDQGTIPSTALISLQDISRWDPAKLSPAIVKHYTMNVLRQNNAGTLALISAFHVAGERKWGAVSSYARKTAFDAQSDPILRMSAIYALGEIGETLGLEKLVNNTNKQIKTAATLALKGK